MRPLHTFIALALSSQLVLGCSDGSSDDPLGSSGPSGPSGPSADPATADPLGDPLIDPNPGGGPIAGACLIPPDFRAGDSATYRYTDAAGVTMDISLAVTSDESSAIVFDITEGDSVYQAAVPTFCNDTPELDLPDGGISASVQALVDQYQSRPLLREIVQPGFGRFDDGATGLDSEVTDTCAEGEASVPPPDGPSVDALACTFTYDPDIVGSTVTVRTTIARSRRDIVDYGRLVEKVETGPDGSTRSLVLVSFDPAG